MADRGHAARGARGPSAGDGEQHTELPDARSRPDRLVLGVTLATALCVAIVLGRWAFQTGLWCDELLFLRAIELGPVQGLCASGSSHPPLLRWLLFAADSSWSDGVLRLLPLACAVANVFVWSAVLRRVLLDRWLVVLLLPALALSSAWAAVAYQVVPYSLLCLLGSMHAWSWFGLIERPGWRSGVLFAGSAALAAWTHFFGVALLVADLGGWVALLLCTGLSRPLRRAWIGTATATVVLVAPLTPILVFYSRNDRPFPIAVIKDGSERFFLSSRALFKANVMYRAITWPYAWVVVYVALGVLAWCAWRARPAAKAPAGALLARGFTVRAVVAAATLSAGLPALQVYMLISGAPLFERYLSWSGWTISTVLVLACTALPGAWGMSLARLCAAALLALGVTRFVDGSGTRNIATQNWTPIVQEIEKRRQPGDAFFVQDMDLWSGTANFDRMWFERYGRGLLPCVHGAWIGRFDMYRQGLRLDGLEPGVQRVWVFSSLFGSGWLSGMPRAHAAGWRVFGVRAYGQTYALGLFVRAADKAGPASAPR